MASLIYCPDCGGVISEKVPAGMKRCGCGEAPGSRHQRVAPPSKVCCRCAIDLTSRRRYHDSRGYWCEACHIADREATTEKGTPCGSCGRRLDPVKLVSWEGLRICGRCFKERQEARRRPKPIPASRFRSHERRRVLITLLVVFSALLIVTVLRYM
jgi:hypothetical protein